MGMFLRVKTDEHALLSGRRNGQLTGQRLYRKLCFLQFEPLRFNNIFGIGRKATFLENGIVRIQHCMLTLPAYIQHLTANTGKQQPGLPGSLVKLLIDLGAIRYFTAFNEHDVVECIAEGLAVSYKPGEQQFNIHRLLFHLRIVLQKRKDGCISCRTFIIEQAQAVQTVVTATARLSDESRAIARAGEEQTQATQGLARAASEMRSMAKQTRDANAKAGPSKDPEANCYLPGIPRATYALGLPFQIIQGGGDILMAYEYDSANRVITMGPVGIPPIDTWMGTSYGHWEGNTLVVTTLAQNGETWLDRTGNYLTNGATVTERFTLKDKDHMNYDVEIQDPMVYSKPWKMNMTLYRRVEPNAQILEFNCVPFSELMLYGDLLENDGTPKK